MVRFERQQRCRAWRAAEREQGARSAHTRDEQLWTLVPAYMPAVWPQAARTRQLSHTGGLQMAYVCAGDDEESGFMAQITKSKGGAANNK